MIGLTLVVIFSACFNHTNLSIARSLRRVKEVGVRKVNGASQYQVFGQFMTEAVIISIGALILGFVLFFVIKPEFFKSSKPDLPRASYV
ncbi:MAG: FtsX-like permease family protein [Bacteroidota bacterium]